MAIGRANHKRGRKAAQELLERLDGDAFRERAQLTEDEMKVLDRIGSGKYVRNAAAIVQSFRMRIEYAYAKPRQGFDATITRDPRTMSDDEWVALAALHHKLRASAPGVAGDEEEGEGGDGP